MINSYIHAALGRERQKTFLAEAKAYRRAKQVRSHRQRAGTLVAPGSPLRWIPSWLRPDWSRLPGRRPRPAVRGRPVALRDGSKVLIRQVQRTDTPPLAVSFARLSP
jgi:ferric-dicitrate binding protein FerR (iron transport regulator)